MKIVIHSVVEKHVSYNEAESYGYDLPAPKEFVAKALRQIADDIENNEERSRIEGRVEVGPKEHPFYYAFDWTKADYEDSFWLNLFRFK